MLHELRVENLLLMERAELRLAPGLNVLTGDTGEHTHDQPGVEAAVVVLQRRRIVGGRDATGRHADDSQAARVRIMAS